MGTRGTLWRTEISENSLDADTLQVYLVNRCSRLKLHPSASTDYNTTQRELGVWGANPSSL